MSSYLRTGIDGADPSDAGTCKSVVATPRSFAEARVICDRVILSQRSRRKSRTSPVVMPQCQKMNFEVRSRSLMRILTPSQRRQQQHDHLQDSKQPSAGARSEVDAITALCTLDAKNT